MLAVEPQETIHIYYEREEEKPFTFLPLLFALLCLVSIGAVTLYSYQHPTYEQKTLTIPAHFFTQMFSTTVKIIPTGTKTYPVTHAQGILTLTNGSVISEELPSGLIFTSTNGVEVQTDAAVAIPAGSANGYGVATVEAHAVIGGTIGNIPTDAINQVEGTSIYIRNLQPFTGGRDAYTATFMTPQDKQTALSQARQSLVVHPTSHLVQPCLESMHWSKTLHLTWTCQFFTYPSLQGMKVTRVQLFGKNLLVDVVFVARPHEMLLR